MRQVQQFLKGGAGEPWCKDCLERELGRPVHATLVQLEGHRDFDRAHALCNRCRKIRLIIRYTG